jgi:hypothetical protein
MSWQTSSKRRLTLALLAIGLALPAAISAVPKDDLNTQQRADPPAIPSIWEQPADPAPLVVVRPPETQPPPARALSPNPLWEIPLSNLSTTRERPIFSPSRRPPPPVVIAAPPAPPAPQSPKLPRAERPQLTLVGTVSGDNEWFGIFVDQTTKAALRLKVGEDYQGWILRAVQGREVTLEYEQQTAIMTLPQPGTTAPGQPPPRSRAEGAAAQRQMDTQQRDERR